jgi:hypothetical protein
LFLQIVSLWSLSIWIRIIFNTDELVNQTRHWNQVHHRQDFFLRKEHAASKTHASKCTAGKIFLTES